MHGKWLIAVDLDGTLFGADHCLSTRTVDTMYAVVERGHAIVIVTGRSAHSAIPKLEAIPPGVRVICSNGAYEYSRSADRIVWSQALSAAVAVEIRQSIVEQLPGVSFGWESSTGLGFDEQFAQQAGGVQTLERGGKSEVFGQDDVLKLYVRSLECSCAELQHRLSTLLAGRAEVSTSGAPFVELTAPGVNKSTGLARVAADLGFSVDRTIAFGDNHNDLPMLRWVHEAVAMGNAVDEVRAVADTVTDSNADDGVAKLLENRFLEKPD